MNIVHSNPELQCCGSDPDPGAEKFVTVPDRGVRRILEGGGTFAHSPPPPPPLPKANHIFNPDQDPGSYKRLKLLPVHFFKQLTKLLRTQKAKIRYIFKFTSFDKDILN